VLYEKILGGHMGNKLPIFQVTSKKITEILEKELERRRSYLSSIVKKVQKVMPSVASVTHSEQSFSGSIIPRALVFTPETLKQMDLTKWKECESVFYKGARRKSWWPKKNTKEGRELSKKLREAMPSEKFFQGEEIKKLLNYKPSKGYETISPKRIRATSLCIGYKKEKGKPIRFFFGGYTGYTPPRGVKEILMSEYNRIFS